MFKICEELVLIAIIITFFYKFHKLLFCLVLSAITTHLIKFLLLCNLCISYFAHNIFISFISTTTISLFNFIFYHPSLFITLSFLLISFIYFLFVLFSFHLLLKTESNNLCLAFKYHHSINNCYFKIIKIFHFVFKGRRNEQMLLRLI